MCCPSLFHFAMILTRHIKQSFIFLFIRPRLYFYVMSKLQAGTGANPFGVRNRVASAAPQQVAVVTPAPSGYQFMTGTSYPWGPFQTMSYVLTLHEPTTITSLSMIQKTAQMDYVLNDGSSFDTLFRALLCFRDTGDDSPPLYIPLIWTRGITIASPDYLLLPGNYTFLIGFFNDQPSLTSSTIDTYQGINVNTDASAPFFPLWQYDTGLLYYNSV